MGNQNIYVCVCVYMCVCVCICVYIYIYIYIYIYVCARVYIYIYIYIYIYVCVCVCVCVCTCVYIYVYIYIYIYICEVHTIGFQTFFVWALLLIVYTWNFSPLQSNLLPFQQLLEGPWKSSCVSVSMTFVTAFFISSIVS